MWIQARKGRHVTPRLIDNLSHESLAEMIGSVWVVVSRQFQHWKQQGIVDAHRGHLEVEALQELVKRAEELPHKALVREPCGYST